MKKLCLLLVFLLAFPLCAAAEEPDISVTMDGARLDDGYYYFGKPQMIDNRIYVPWNVLGSMSIDISYDQNTRLLWNDTLISVQGNEATLTTAKETKTVTYPTDIMLETKDGDSLYSARFFADLIGADLAWDDEAQNLTVTTHPQVVMKANGREITIGMYRAALLACCFMRLSTIQDTDEDSNSVRSELEPKWKEAAMRLAAVITSYADPKKIEVLFSDDYEEADYAFLDTEEVADFALSFPCVGTAKELMLFLSGIEDFHKHCSEFAKNWEPTPEQYEELKNKFSYWNYYEYPEAPWELPIDSRLTYTQARRDKLHLEICQGKLIRDILEGYGAAPQKELFCNQDLAYCMPILCSVPEGKNSGLLPNYCNWWYYNNIAFAEHLPLPPYRELDEESKNMITEDLSSEILLQYLEEATADMDIEIVQPVDSSAQLQAFFDYYDYIEEGE